MKKLIYILISLLIVGCSTKENWQNVRNEEVNITICEKSLCASFYYLELGNNDFTLFEGRFKILEKEELFDSCYFYTLENIGGEKTILIQKLIDEETSIIDYNYLLGSPCEEMDCNGVLKDLIKERFLGNKYLGEDLVFVLK